MSNFEIYYEGWRKSLTIILLFKILLIIYLTKSYSIFSLIQKNLNNYSIIFLSFYFLLSLSPPTDADSLDYHLGVPLYLFFEQKLIIQENWFHHMLFGYGEFLNFFGIIFGSNIFGQYINFFSVFSLLICLNLFKKKFNSKIDVSLFVLATPLLIMLIYSSKTQLFPSLLFLLSLFLIIENYKNLKNNYVIILIFVFFNIGCKFNFVITSFIISLILLYFSYREKKILQFFTKGISVFLLILLPIFFLKFSLYNDLFPPAFEFLKTNPNLSLVKFFSSLKTDDATFYNFEPYSLFFIFLPFITSLTFQFGNITGLLSVSFLFYYYYIYLAYKSLKTEKKSDQLKIILFVSLSINLIFIFLPNFQPRYWLEFYWTFIIGLAFLCKNDKVAFYLNKLNKLQSIFILLFLILSVFTFFPASLTEKQHQKVLKKYTFGYNQSSWINSNLKKNESVISERLRSRVFLDQNSVSRERIFKFPDRDKYELLKMSKIDNIVLEYPINDKDLKLFFDECADPDGQKKSVFFNETRNFLSELRNVKYTLIFFRNLCK
ncbi:DUF1420 domain-containing protein [Candidatus Pelagibacter sp.]|nr:DUF1420 domain-containing protein [Candidatus Pelagibacter sp.]